jgi:hypothetical protein
MALNNSILTEEANISPGLITLSLEHTLNDVKREESSRGEEWLRKIFEKALEMRDKVQEDKERLMDNKIINFDTKEKQNQANDDDNELVDCIQEKEERLKTQADKETRRANAKCARLVMLYLNEGQHYSLKSSRVQYIADEEQRKRQIEAARIMEINSAILDWEEQATLYEAKLIRNLHHKKLMKKRREMLSRGLDAMKINSDVYHFNVRHFPLLFHELLCTLPKQSLSVTVMSPTYTLNIRLSLLSFKIMFIWVAVIIICIVSSLISISISK